MISNSRSVLDRSADALIGAASADIARHGGVDVVIRRLRRVLQQRRRRHDLAGLAVAALHHLQLQPRLLQGRALRRLADRLDRGDRALADRGDAGRVAAPSTCTVQAPHSAWPQPNLVPVMPSTSRSTHSSRVSPSTSTSWGVPLIFNMKAMAASRWLRLIGSSWPTWTAPAGCVHQWARVAHGRTRMIVFPLRRSVGFKAATASSRVETLPMFVRSRPSRTRWTIVARDLAGGF